jgi:hypothetical protein
MIRSGKVDVFAKVAFTDGSKESLEAAAATQSSRWTGTWLVVTLES